MLNALILALSPAAAAPPAAPLPTLVTPAQDWKAAVDRGKQQLFDGDVDGAVASFAEAHSASGGDVATELWVLRGRVAKGDVDGAFDRIVAIDASGEADGPDLSYVIGAARFATAEGMAAAGSGAAPGAYQEAAGYLKDATSAAPDGYPDAWAMLATSGLRGGDLEAATTAVTRALELRDDTETRVLAAKVRTQRGIALLGKESTKDAGQAFLRQAVEDTDAAASNLEEASKNANTLADIHLQKGMALVYLAERDAAKDAYAEALRWNPTMADYGQMMAWLKGEDADALFIQALREGADRFEEQWGEDERADALLHWWLGYAEHFALEYDASIASFETALAKSPNYTSCHWYIGLSHWRKAEAVTGDEAKVQEHLSAAADAWEAHASKNRSEFAATAMAQGNIAFIGRAVQQTWKDGRPDLSNVLAARFGDLLVLANPNDALNWSSAGVVNRDAGLAVQRREPEDPPKSAEAYFERSLDCYERAITLERRPEFLNDGAVILHYYLERDYDKAIEMYDAAEALAVEWLENGGHDFTGEAPDAKQVVETALRDSRNNRAALKKKIEGGE